MKTFVIDFNYLPEYISVWRLVIAALDLPDWCGTNPDAIWDMLTGWIELPCKIIMLSTDKVPQSGHNSYEMLIKIIKRAHDQDWGVDYEVQ